MKGIQSARNAKSNLNTIFSNRKEKYKKSINNYKTSYSDYLGSDLLIQFGLFIGVISTAIVFISLIEIINYTNPTQNIILLVCGLLGLKYTQNSIKNGFDTLLNND